MRVGACQQVRRTCSRVLIAISKHSSEAMSMSTQQTAPNQNIESTLTESRSFPPPKEFSEKAIIKSAAEYEKIRARASADPEGFWADIARELHWFKPWDKVLEWDVPWAKWF